MNLSYLKAIEPAGVEWNGDIKFFISEYKKHKIDRSYDLMNRCLETLRRNNVSGDESIIYDTLFTAAADAGDVKLCKWCLDYLKSKYPLSSRVGILSGRYLELCGEYEKALTLYTELQTKDLSNLTIMKRKVSCYRQMRNIVKAVQSLHEILSCYASDMSCWHELYELYLFAGDYMSAAHCCEEIVMIDQSLAANHNRLADVYYTLGSINRTDVLPGGGSSKISMPRDNESMSKVTTSAKLNVETKHSSIHTGPLLKGSGDLGPLDYVLLARKHYVLALERQGPTVNAHSVYGLLAASRAIESITSENDASHATAVNRELLKYAQDHLRDAGLPFQC